jgi:signal transduction histidine kinase
LREGDIYTLHSFCGKRFSDKCKNFYKNISEPGTYICPYGFSTYVTSFGLSEGLIFTSLLIQGRYDKKKLKIHRELKNKFSEDEISRLLGLFDAQQKRSKNLEIATDDETTLIRGILHEVRRLSREIESQRCELRNYQVPNKKTTAIIENIYATTQLISTRIDTYELYKNPSAITKATQPCIDIYKKFDKARFIIDAQANNKDIKLSFSGEFHLFFEGYEIFNLLPYILLDNAVKYTRPGMEINVNFDESLQSVEIINIGPKVKKDQIDHIFEKSFRGEYSKDFEGTGLELFMARQITELHRIECSAYSSDVIEFHINNIPYSEFKIILDFKNCKCSRFNNKI